MAIVKGKIFIDVKGEKDEIDAFKNETQDFFELKLNKEFQGSFKIEEEWFLSGDTSVWNKSFETILKQCAAGKISAFISIISTNQKKTAIVQIDNGAVTLYETQFPQSRHHPDKWPDWNNKRDRINELRKKWLSQNIGALESSAQQELHCFKCGGYPNRKSIVIIGYDGNDENIIIPEKLNDFRGYIVKTIDNKAFANKTSIVSVSFPETLTGIGIESFSGCSNLSNIIMPASIALTKIGEKAFEGCGNLSEETKKILEKFGYGGPF